MGRAAKPVRKVPIAKDGAASPRDDDAARTPRVEDAALTPRDRAFLESPPEDALADDAVAGDALAGDVPADKRCFVDLDVNTGRVQIRVVQPLL